MLCTNALGNRLSRPPFDWPASDRTYCLLKSSTYTSLCLFKLDFIDLWLQLYSGYKWVNQYLLVKKKAVCTYQIESMLHKLRFNESHRIMSNGIFRRPFSSSCSRRVAATSRDRRCCKSIKMEELECLDTPHIHSSNRI